MAKNHFAPASAPIWQFGQVCSLSIIPVLVLDEWMPGFSYLPAVLPGAPAPHHSAGALEVCAWGSEARGREDSRWKRAGLVESVSQVLGV